MDEFMDSRYRKQIAYAPFGLDGQKIFEASRVGIVGLGALGSMLAERLTRMGIGQLSLIDRDWVDLDNLPRQTLYTEQDAEQRQPKAIAAKKHLHEINHLVQIEPQVVDFVPENGEQLLSDCDLVLDGTDNLETRFLINDVCLKWNIPWVHGGCVGTDGQVLGIIPGATACYRCLVPEPLAANQMLSCDLHGVLGSTVAVIASWQVMEATKILLGKHPAKQSPSGQAELMLFQMWSNDVKRIRLPIDVARPGYAGCIACQQRRFEFLEGQRGSDTTILCGRNAVQIQANQGIRTNLKELADRFRNHGGKLIESPYLLRWEIENVSFSIFADGRTIVHGTEDPAVARGLRNKWIGG
jgi:molybdopterin-synthase adenylyltransferase